MPPDDARRSGHPHRTYRGAFRFFHVRTFRCVALPIMMLTLDAQLAAAAPEWQTTNEVGKRHNMVIAVCIPGEEIVCVGFGCRDAYGFDFVEMIVGDWLEGPTRLRVAGHTAMVSMSADDLASREMNIPVSRGYVEATFVARMVGHKMLRVEAAGPRYAAVFPLAGFEQAYGALGRTCDSANALLGEPSFKQR